MLRSIGEQSGESVESVLKKCKCKQKTTGNDERKLKRRRRRGEKGKVFPYSLPSVGPGADPGVQAVSPQVT